MQILNLVCQLNFTPVLLLVSDHSSAVVTSGGVDNPPTNDLGTSGGLLGLVRNLGRYSSNVTRTGVFFNKNTPVAIVV